MASTSTPEGGAAPEGGEVFAFQVQWRASCPCLSRVPWRLSDQT